MPALQEEHVEGEVAPTAALAVPRPQSVQFVAPVEGEKEPPGQGLQSWDPALEMLPGAQGVHVDEEVAPRAEEALPAGHKVQVRSP